MMHGKAPSVQRIADLQQLIADFSAIQRVIHIADKGRQENDAEHSFGLAMTCWFVAPKVAPALDITKILMYALAHDIVEIHAGDTYIFDKAKSETKSEREDAAIKQIAEEWPDFPELAKYAKGYKEHADAEAKFVYVIDKMLPPIMITLGENKEYWHRQKITRDMHHDHKRDKMAASPEASIYYEELVNWLDENVEYYKEPHKG